MLNQKLRDKQIDYLDYQDSKETLNSTCAYLIMINGKTVDRAECAGTIIMLLNSKYNNINVFIKTIWGQL